MPTIAGFSPTWSAPAMTHPGYLVARAGRIRDLPTEFEAKILDIDPNTTTTAILAAGGTKVRGQPVLMRRYVYDVAPGDQSRWIRLREAGGEVTLTVKEITHDGIDGTHEWEVAVDDFDTANALLGRLGYTPK